MHILIDWYWRMCLASSGLHFHTSSNYIDSRWCSISSVFIRRCLPVTRCVLPRCRCRYSSSSGLTHSRVPAMTAETRQEHSRRWMSTQDWWHHVRRTGLWRYSCCSYTRIMPTSTTITIQLVNIWYEPGGLGSCSHPESGKAIIFLENAKFSDRSQLQKIKKCSFCIYERKIGIHSVQRYEVPKIRDFYQYILGGVSRASSFFGRCQIFFRAEIAPRKKWPICLWCHQ